MSTPRKATPAPDVAEAIVAAELRRLTSTPHEFEQAPRGSSCGRCSLGLYATVHGRQPVPEPGPPTRPWT